ncbi:hypothetical protein ES319_D02G102100v1 [Gossypium barbadense]|uniref:Cytochrome P450 n=1 Tax=Gossypium barbadense TaxID=3634 RepID=A0A5J5SBC7_GOSBA|nr:hypothetical protein ES319_D02G102100v1 [Gossypium barbadense]
MVFLFVSMENLYHYLVIILFILLTIKLLIHKTKNLPPSPFSLPIIGHLHLIKNPLYQSLATLLSKYGPVLYLKFGCRHVLVLSSPSAVEECLTKNDTIFANRPRTMAGDLMTYNYTTFVWAPYGSLWRNHRRLSAVEIFCSNSVEKFSSIREEEVADFVRRLFEVSSGNGTQKVDLKYLFCLLTANVMWRTVAGKRGVEDPKDVEAEKMFFTEFKSLFFPSLGTNICDFFPVLRWIGFLGIEKKLKEIHRRRDEYLQNLVDGIRLNKSKKNFSLIERLLSLQQDDPDFCPDQVIKTMVLMMFIAGTESTAITMEWTMALLLSHPEALQKARDEIIRHVGHERLLNESDLPKLLYLRCVVNETLRLYPATPLLLPHCPSEDCVVDGYEIPKGTILLVHAWAIQRDPSIWEEPTKFKPERFYEGTLEDKEGFKYLPKYLPFGLGRRACPGRNMGLRSVLLAIGVFIQCFEWENVGSDKVDMTPDTIGLSIFKARPLEALCRPRPDVIKLLSQL